CMPRQQRSRPSAVCCWRTPNWSSGSMLPARSCSATKCSPRTPPGTGPRTSGRSAAPSPVSPSSTCATGSPHPHPGGTGPATRRRRRCPRTWCGAPARATWRPTSASPGCSSEGDGCADPTGACPSPAPPRTLTNGGCRGFAPAIFGCSASKPRARRTTSALGPGRIVSSPRPERPYAAQEQESTLMARVVVEVMPKPEILDPQGKAVAAALPRLGLTGITDARQGKRFELEVEGSGDGLARARRAAEEVLSNPVIEDVVSVHWAEEN